MVRPEKRAVERIEPGGPSARGRGHGDIVAVLGSEILSGIRKPGSRLPSAEEMFVSFGVSRVVLREVTRTLAAKGMVTSKSRVGTLVAPSSHWNWLDPDVLDWRSKVGLDQNFLNHISETRLAVEPVSAALAARRRTRQDLVAMRAALKMMREAKGNHHIFSEGDLRFHVAVSTASGNPLLRSFLSATEIALAGFLRMMSVGAIADEKTHARSAARHQKVLEAIEARNEDAARDAMIHVINEGFKHARASIASRKR